MHRREIQKLYRVITVVNPQTGKEERKAEYIGPYYHVSMEGFRLQRISMWLALAAVAVAFVTAGCLPAMAQRQVYVLAPYILCLLPIYFGFLGLWKVSHYKERIDEVQYRDGLVTLHRSGVALALLAFLWQLTGVIYAFQQISQHMWDASDLLFLTMSTLCFMGGMIIWNGCGRIQVTKDGEEETAEEPDEDGEENE